MVGAALGNKRKQVVFSTKTEARDNAGQPFFPDSLSS